MKAVVRLWRSLPPGAGWFLAGAVLFAGGAINAAFYGLHKVMQAGLLGACTALCVVYVFYRKSPRSDR